MNRNVELFLRKGIVIKPATKPTKQIPGYGIIFFPDPSDPHNQDAGREILTMYQHSFEDPKNQPGNNKEVYFFIIPLEYIMDIDIEGPGKDSPLLAINVTATSKYMMSSGVQKYHPCNSITTIDKDAVSANYAVHGAKDKFTHEYYGINDYGELTLITVKSTDDTSYPPSKNTRFGKLVPWDKIVCHPTNKGNSSRVISLKRNKKRSSAGKIEFKILKMKFKEMDPKWTWADIGSVKKSKIKKK